MSGRLTTNTTPFERKRNCVFAETFETDAKVEANSGTFGAGASADFGFVADDATTKYIAYPYTLQHTALTIIVDLQDLEFISGGYQVLVTNRDGAGGGNTQFEFDINNEASTTAKTLFYFNGTLYPSTATFSPTAKQLVMTISGTDLIFYVDGVKLGDTVAIGGLGTVNTRLTIGSSYDIANYSSECKFKWVKIFDEALTAGEILDYANNTTYDSTVIGHKATSYVDFRDRSLDDSVLNIKGAFLSTPYFTRDGLRFNGSSDAILFGDMGITAKSVLIMLEPATLTENICKFDTATHSMEIGAGTLTATGFDTPTLYVDGIASSTVTSENRFVGVTTATGVAVDNLTIGATSTFYEGRISAIVMFEDELSADEMFKAYSELENTTFPSKTNAKFTDDDGSGDNKGWKTDWAADVSSAAVTAGLLENTPLEVVSGGWKVDTCSIDSEVGGSVIADGDMEAVGTADWIGLSGAVLSKEAGARTGGTGTQFIRATYVASAFYGAQQNNVLNGGKKYRIRGWCRGDGTNAPIVMRKNPNVTLKTLTNSTTWQEFDFLFEATTSTSIGFQTSGAGAAGHVDFDDCSIVEVVDNVKCITDTSVGTVVIPRSVMGQTPTEAAYGEWEFRVLRNVLAVSTINVMFLATEPGAFNASGQDGWLLNIGDANQVNVYEVVNGSISLKGGAAGITTPGVWCTLNITRSAGGVFVVKVDDVELYTFTDATNTTSEYITITSAVATANKIALADIGGDHSFIKKII